MSPPRAGRSGRTALGRLVDGLRRRLRPQRAAAPPPATVPGLGSGEETAVAAVARPASASASEPAPEPASEPAPEPASEPASGVPAAEPEPAGADARFDAARERLRARIEPPEPDEGD